MSIEEFFKWAKTHNYPQLVIGEKEILRPGFEAYQRLYQAGDISRAIQRVQEGLARLETHEKTA